MTLRSSSVVTYPSGYRLPFEVGRPGDTRLTFRQLPTELLIKVTDLAAAQEEGLRKRKEDGLYEQRYRVWEMQEAARKDLEEQVRVLKEENEKLKQSLQG